VNRKKHIWRGVLAVFFLHSVIALATYVRITVDGGHYSYIGRTVTDLYALGLIILTLWSYERYKHYR